MRILVFILCFLFSYIFYVFSLLWEKKSLLFSYPVFENTSLIWPPIFSSIIFIIIGLILYIRFTPSKEQKNIIHSYFPFIQRVFWYYVTKIWIYILICCITAALILYWFFTTIWIIVAYIFLHMSYISFFIFPKASFAREYSKELKYVWLLQGYVSIILCIVSIQITSLWVASSVWVLVMGVFNYGIHKLYTNYISLWFVGIIFLYLIYYGVNIILDIL